MLDLLQLLVSPQGLTAAVMLVFLAGLSDGVGTRAVVLLINRITPTRFFISLLGAALLFLLSAAFWVGGLWLAARAFFYIDESLPLFFVAVSVAYVPLLGSALALLPLIGPLIRWLLRVWSFGVALGAMQALGLSLWQAALCALAGWLLQLGTSWLFSEAAGQLWLRIWSRVTGRPHPFALDDLPRVIPGYSPKVRQ